MAEQEHNLVVQAWHELRSDTREEWDDRINSLVPAPPLITELSSPKLSLDDFYPKVLSEKISHDPVLGSKILAVANSAKFGLTTPLTSIQRAMVHLGFNLVRSIIVNYMLNERFTKPNPVPTEIIERVRRWSAGSSVIAFHWAQALDLKESSTAATLALLSRIGTMLMGILKPIPGREYWEIQDEVARLSYEVTIYNVATPALSAELAKRWELPEPIPMLLGRLWEPVTKPMIPDPLDPYPKMLVLVATSVLIVDHMLRQDMKDVNELLSRNEYRFLKHNLGQHQIIGVLNDTLNSTRVVRDLSTMLE